MTIDQKYVRDGLANIVASIRYEDLPADVVQQAKLLIIDTLACAFGASASEPVAIVRRLVAELGGRPEATLWGTGEKTSSTMATWVNGTMLRYLNANDYYFGRDGSHGSGNLAPALALCERQGLSGQDLILAMVIAYEVQLRFCDYAGEPRIWDRGWHNATNMQFSSAALSARLLGLDANGIANAIAISASHNNTLAQLQRGHIPLMKATAEATVAKGGLEAALLASHGLTGPEEIFEGKVGWAHAVAGAIDYEGLLAPVQGNYRIMRTCTKPFAAEAMTQAAIQAAITIRATAGFDVDNIVQVDALFHEYAFKKPSWDPKKLLPTDRETADHSFPYMIAVALLEGDCSDHQFRDALLHSPVVRRLMEKVSLGTDPELTSLWPGSSGAKLMVKMTSGEVLFNACLYPPGHPKNPETEQQISAKFLRMAGPILSAPLCMTILDKVWGLEELVDCGELGKILGNRQGG